MSPLPQKSVSIVGAGVAGLRAASYILQHAPTCRVSIFEANDRVGGRVYTYEKDGWRVDMGANWIHGMEGNPITPIARETGAIFAALEDAAVYPHGLSVPLPRAESEKLFGRTWEVADNAIAYSKENSGRIGADESLFDFAKKDVEEDKDLSKEEKRWVCLLSEFFTNFSAEDVRRLSLKYYFLEEELPGERPYLASTYSPILEAIAKPSLDGGIVRLSTPITHVDASSSHSVTITTMEGTKEAFDAVIIAVPLGVLKKQMITITPSLPTRLQQAIDSLGFGVLEKIFLKFDSAWWLPKDKEKANPPSFHAFLPDPSKPLEPPNVLTLMLSLASLPTGTDIPALAFYIAADQAHYVSSLSDSDLDAWIHSYLRLLPNYSPTQKPTAILKTSWGSDTWSGGGSYTHINTGTKNAVEDIEVLGDGCVHGRMWFAGEHVGTWRGMGTVNGAYESGERAAKGMISALKLGLQTVNDVEDELS
ncbi:amine oxidase [Saitoella complicata NRRL Y-17804]|uniref:Amine oxidase domain-containing protein n=1 Tax=Saitoella complicata (strain BCRC 22490 / CBS 7301 / JCM 7358 / NBRC 10748 / NRRL Y-17804) TaxID=698492 RepID=A0A0E9NNW8_SAICN|nr:amine oxidase [Saitoella complicata NRRL Y-17804]ODQ50375.1 amine oxidase [Saitoella complicata NRRL Y-17804]GAO51125.1 hypothetical protein G7K_5236-t1 [Saitoella complicata NRRL Y-17804]